MKRAIRFKMILFMAWLFSSRLYGGSILSSYGVGIPFVFPNARSMGMGGVSIAIPSAYSISRINPAALREIQRTSLSLQYFYEQNKYEDESGKATSQYANFNGFTFVLPFGKEIGCAASLSPLSRMDYHLIYQQTQSEALYVKSVEGSGGLNTFSFSLYYGIHSKIALGFSGDYIFGKIKENWKVTYDNADYVETSDLLSTKNWGYGLTTGILVRPISALQLGAVYRPKIELDTRTDTYYEYTTDMLTHHGSISIPSSWGAGISFEIGRIGLIGMDYQQQNWSQLKINEQRIQRFQNSYRISLGGELSPSDDPFDSYFKRMQYRIGICYQPFFVSDLSGQAFTEKWLTVGFGLPLIMNIAQFDLALSFGQRGSLDQNGLSENLFRISCSITGGEKWFIRRHP
jgi:hypothetical protein